MRKLYQGENWFFPILCLAVQKDFIVWVVQFQICRENAQRLDIDLPFIHVIVMLTGTCPSRMFSSS